LGFKGWKIRVKIFLNGALRIGHYGEGLKLGVLKIL
jgi:hypothetical protein